MAEILIPNIGDAEDVEVIELCVAPGDSVGPDDAIIVIESDKASMEVPAGMSGTIEALLVAIGDKVEEGRAIARLKASVDAGNSENSGHVEAEAEAQPLTSGDSEAVAGSQAPAADKAPAAADKAPAAADKESAAADKESATSEAESREVVVEVPDIGDAEDVVVIEVAIRVGDVVVADQMLVVVESDKASMEIPAVLAGEITAVHVAEGDPVVEGSPLVSMRVDQDVVGESPPAPAKVEEPSASQPELPTTQKPVDVQDAKVEARTGAGGKIYAGPATRRLARELGVELEGVNGSGSRGRIVKDDVKAHVKTAMTTGSTQGSGIPSLPEIDFARFGAIELVPLSRVRVVGAQNLHRSWLNVVHVTQHDQADVTELEAFRRSLKDEAESRGVKLTPLAFIVKACCYALKAFPTFNASLDREVKNYIYKHYYNLGFAVDTEQGLVVPVIKDADKKGVWELSAEIVELADKAREQKLAIDDMQGGTFSISSLGAIGGTAFTPIVNAPEVAILGVSRLTKQPVWNGTEFEPRDVLPLSLSYDHRAINGAEAGRFVVHLAELLSDIRRLSL